MSIELIARRPRDLNRQIAYIKIDNNIEFSVGNVPAGLDDAKCLAHLQDRESEIRFVMLLKQYPEAEWRRFKTDKNTGLEALQAWVDAGCVNPVETDKDEEGKPIFKDVKIEMKPIGYKIPKEITALAALDSAKTITELKAAVKAIIVGE